MSHAVRRGLPAFLAFAVAAPLLAARPEPPEKEAPGPVATLPSETPEKFVPVTDGWDHERREVMVPMRDGVKLMTVVLVPKGAKGAPILLTRTPYDARKMTRRASSAHLGPLLFGYDNATDVIVEGARSASCRTCGASTAPRAAT